MYIAHMHIRIIPYCATLQNGIDESTFEAVRSLTQINVDCKVLANNSISR